MFNSHAQALRAAKATAAELAVGRSEVHTLTRHELVIYRRAIQALNWTGVDLEAAPRTRNNFRLVIGTLLKFGQVRGCVAKDHPGISTIEKASYTDGEAIVFTPTEIETLLKFADDVLFDAAEGFGEANHNR